MNPLIHHVAVIMLAFWLSGCAAVQDDPPTEEPTDGTNGPTSTDSPPSDGGTPEVPGENSMELRFDGCSDSLHALIYVVDEAFEVPTLPGWEGNTLLTGELHYRLRSCERVSVGPFERGPINLFYETHTNRQVPASCAEGGDYTNTGVLHRIWVDDAEIAHYLRTTYLMPANFATISLAEVASDAIVDFRWTVELPGSEPSELVYHHFPENGYPQREFPSFRYFWASGPESVSYMDTATETHTVGVEEPSIVEGTLRAPLLYANPGTERFVGYGGAGIDGYVHGEIHLFKDTQCSEPL